MFLMERICGLCTTLQGGKRVQRKVTGRKAQAIRQRLRSSFYKIASRIGTSGGILSMWLSERAKPGPEELVAIEKFLKG